MITKVFTSKDTKLYAMWHYENGGIVLIVVPEVGVIRLSLSKAEELSEQLETQARYGRFASENPT